MTTTNDTSEALDLDAIEAEVDYLRPVAPVTAGHADALIARVRELAAKLDASAQAFDALVADVWRATGETHEPPADVAALLARVAAARREGAEVMREECVGAAWDNGAKGLRNVNVTTIINAIRALPLPEAPPDASTYRRGAGAMRGGCAQAAARVANAWARRECRCACGSSLAGLAAAEACAAEIRALPIVEAP